MPVVRPEALVQAADLVLSAERQNLPGDPLTVAHRTARARLESHHELARAERLLNPAAQVGADRCRGDVAPQPPPKGRLVHHAVGHPVDTERVVTIQLRQVEKRDQVGVFDFREEERVAPPVLEHVPIEPVSLRQIGGLDDEVVVVALQATMPAAEQVKGTRTACCLKHPGHAATHDVVKEVLLRVGVKRGRGRDSEATPPDLGNLAGIFGALAMEKVLAPHSRQEWQ